MMFERKSNEFCDKSAQFRNMKSVLDPDFSSKKLNFNRLSCDDSSDQRQFCANSTN
jgi:hypothetical protein